MVKSYQGVRAAPAKTVKEQLIKVSDYMTRRLITFSPDQTIDDVIQILLAKKISGGPVVDDQNNLVGVISEGDCLKEVVKGKYNNTPTLHGTVGEHMAKEVKTIDPDLNIFEAAQMFLNIKLRRFPVIENGKLVGQISQKDIMKAMQNLKGTTW